MTQCFFSNFAVRKHKNESKKKSKEIQNFNVVIWKPCMRTFFSLSANWKIYAQFRGNIKLWLRSLVERLTTLHSVPNSKLVWTGIFFVAGVDYLNDINSVIFFAIQLVKKTDGIIRTFIIASSVTKLDPQDNRRLIAQNIYVQCHIHTQNGSFIFQSRCK